MTAGNTRDLLRDHAEPQRATYVELFFDVIFVFALTRLSNTLFHNLTWLGALHTVILLAAFWWVWVFTAWTTNRLNPAQPAIQLVIVPIALGTLIMAGTVPAAFGKDGLAFAVTDVVIQIGRAFFVTVALRGREVSIGSLQQLIWACFSGVLWIVGAFTTGPVRVLIWLFAAALGYTMTQLDFRLPRLGPARDRHPGGQRGTPRRTLPAVHDRRVRRGDPGLRRAVRRVRLQAESGDRPRAGVRHHRAVVADLLLPGGPAPAGRDRRECPAGSVRPVRLVRPSAHGRRHRAQLGRR
ncbi:low temperature requirement protein A [Micromonospora sp. MP36]|nr:low temperature requirement protein A [Micromonospora sp. MP36]